MKFDTVIIGGGLTGLTAALTLEQAGRRTAVVSTGQSALHFCSGSFDLLSAKPDGTPLAIPADGFDALPTHHPYRLIGRETIERLLPHVKPLLEEAGIRLHGNSSHNHLRLSPIGIFKPTWLTIDGYFTLEDTSRLRGRHYAIIAPKGYLDFYPDFLKASLENFGATTETFQVSTPALDALRRLRATTIAHALKGDALDQLAEAINALVPLRADAALFPAVVGGDDLEDAHRLLNMIDRPLRYVATMGMAVPGVEAQRSLQRRYRNTDGAFLPGDTVVEGLFSADGTRLVAVRTSKLGDDLLEADNFIFAAGSFFSKGIVALPDAIVEPALGLDVHAPADRSEWFHHDLFRPQPFMAFGVATDAYMHALRGGKPVENLLVAGAALPGAQSISEGSGSGIALVSALRAAELILSPTPSRPAIP